MSDVPANAAVPLIEQAVEELPMVPVTVTLEPGQVAWLDGQAQATGHNRSSALRAILDRARAELTGRAA